MHGFQFARTASEIPARLLRAHKYETEQACIEPLTRVCVEHKRCMSAETKAAAKASGSTEFQRRASKPY